MCFFKTAERTVKKEERISTAGEHLVLGNMLYYRRRRKKILQNSSTKNCMPLTELPNLPQKCPASFREVAPLTERQGLSQNITERQGLSQRGMVYFRYPGPLRERQTFHR